MQKIPNFRLIRLGDARRLTKGDVGFQKELTGVAYQAMI